VLRATAGGRKLPQPVVVLAASSTVSKPPGSLGDAGREVWGRLWVAGQAWLSVETDWDCPTAEVWIGGDPDRSGRAGTCLWLGDQDVVAGAGAGLCAECARAPQRRRGQHRKQPGRAVLAAAPSPDV